MPGLTFAGGLTLTPAQGVTVLAVCALGLCWRTQRATVAQDVIGLIAVLVWLRVAFAGHQEGIDVQTTWAVLPRFVGLSWHAVRSEVAMANYLKFQPPLYAWVLSRWPVYAGQQSLALACGAVVLAAAYRHGGRVLAWMVCASPLFQVMTVQPSNDWWSCALLSLATITPPPVSAGLLLAAGLLKYTAYVVIPWFVVALQGWMLVPLLGIGGYWAWAVTNGEYWGAVQSAFLRHIFGLGLVNVHGDGAAAPWGARIVATLRWRWQHVTHGGLGVLAWGVWLFPSVSVRHAWPVWGVAAAVLIGYGNPKYGVLLFPLMFLFSRKTLTGCENANMLNV